MYCKANNERQQEKIGKSKRKETLMCYIIPEGDIFQQNNGVERKLITRIIRSTWVWAVYTRETSAKTAGTNSLFQHFNVNA